MATDDFSFPTVNKSSSTRSVRFSPFWQLSPAATCTDDDDDDDDDDEDEDHSTLVTSPGRKSSASIEGVDDDRIVVSSDVQDQEEKKDMLWEDFNEELYPVRSTSSDYNYMSGDMLQLGCVGLGAFNFSKSNATTTGSTLTKPSVVLIIKVLKRLFFLHNSQHHNLNKPAKR